jgi:hypothetical protein
MMDDKPRNYYKAEILHNKGVEAVAEYITGIDAEVEACRERGKKLRDERDALKLVVDAVLTGRGLDDALDALDALKGEK